MKIAHLADMHLDAAFASFGRDAARRRRHALEEALKAAIEAAAEADVEAIFVAGDLYEHDRVAPNTGAFLERIFELVAPLPVFIAPGNHDWYGNASLYARAGWSSNVHVFTEDRLQPIELADGLTLWGAAHRAPANTDGFLDAFQVERGGVNVALFHGSEQSAFQFQEEGKVPHSPFRSDQIGAAGLHHVFAGHFHTPVDHPAFTYPGNPEPLTFGEPPEPVRALVVATIAQDGSVSRERLRVAQTAVGDVIVDVSDCASGVDVREKVNAELEGRTGFVRLTLEGELAPDVDLALRDLERTPPSLEGLSVRLGRLRVAYDLEAIKVESTVRGAFVSDVLATDLEEDEKQRVIVTGLRALEGRTDLEVIV